LSTVSHLVRDAVKGWKAATIIVEGEAEKFDAFAASNFALAASGTVALELAMAHLPAVIAYRVSPLTHAIARRMVKIKYANLVNLLLDRPAVPELIQLDCTAGRIAAAVTQLIEDDGARAAQIAAYDSALDLLGLGMSRPSQRAAQEILRMIAA
jgi:lipid-A-disaccharide synthase